MIKITAKTALTATVELLSMLVKLFPPLAHEATQRVFGP